MAAAAVLSPTNFFDVKSPEQFQTLLTEDLDRVSLINFWAPWAEPCVQMNTVVRELANRYPKVLVLQVQAEEQEDISETFDIESVPSFLLLRGHTLLTRISGADAPALTTSLSQHAHTHTFSPQSHTTHAPPSAPEITSYSDEETPEQLEKRMRAIMKKGKVVIFMKGSQEVPKCGFSKKTIKLFGDKGVEFVAFDILTDERVRQGIKVLNEWPTFPQIVVNGEFIGGLDVATEMMENGELMQLLNAPSNS